MRVPSAWSVCGLIFVTAGLVGCGDASRISTREDRQALFDYLLAKTMERESFSPIKNRRLGLDPEAEMRALEDEVVNASSEEELFYALVKLSNARKDRHLRVRTVEGGLRLREDYDASANTNYPEVDLADSGPLTAPIRFAVDYAAAPESYVLFVADVSRDFSAFEGGDQIRGSEVLIAVNDVPIDEYVERIRSYYRYSTENGFWVRLAEGLNRKTPILPESFYGDDLKLTVASEGGEPHSLRVPYLPASSIDWLGRGERRYEGFELVQELGIFDLYRHAGERKVLLLSWRRFGDTLVEDIDALIELAVENEYLDYDLIWDGTRSGGGGRGAYAVQRLSPKPFKTTFGNLRLSDITLPFIELERQQFEERDLSDGAPETIDDGTWLMEWLESDVVEGLETGDDYSSKVPFKTAHAPAGSEGVLEPAQPHFRGRMICLLGPFGGSHLDQFAAIVVDNDLGPVLGMPAGGYSNTWEWEEIVKFPLSGRPVVEFMWSIGHTVRPNGEILEGNPAEVDEYLPVTRENYVEYYPRLLDRALSLLEE